MVSGLGSGLLGQLNRKKQTGSDTQILPDRGSGITACTWSDRMLLSKGGIFPASLFSRKRSSTRKCKEANSLGIAPFI